MHREDFNEETVRARVVENAVNSPHSLRLRVFAVSPQPRRLYPISPG